MDSAGRYIQLFENLSEQALSEIESFVSPDITFSDPFNDLQNIEDFRKLLRKTLRDVDNPAFQVTHQAWADDILFLKWTFTGQIRVLGHWQVTGMSEIHFDAQGKVSRHVDHWDSANQFYLRLPVIGSVLRLIKRRLQV